jgi:putative transposase
MWYSYLMSQKVKITKVSASGAKPFLGFEDDSAEVLVPKFAENAEEIGEWFSNGWRTRFNQLRSRRMKYGENRSLVPLGNVVNSDSVKEARLINSSLLAIPSLVIESTHRIEDGEWWASIKRRNSVKKKGGDTGRMPGFRSFKRTGQHFACWYNGGRNAEFKRTGKKSGIVFITGQNPSIHRAEGDTSSRWALRIHVRVSQKINPYTSVRVNWDDKTLVFVNEVPKMERQPTGKIIGLDRGITHNIADNEGNFFDLDAEKYKKTSARIAFEQKKMAKARMVSGKSKKEYVPSARYLAHKKMAADLYAYRSRVVEDFQHKITTQLVRENDTIITEKLRLADMTKKGKGKRGLNRSLAMASMGRINEMLAYKAEASGVYFQEVPPAYTSQRCFECGYIAPENRESQAIFQCVSCNHKANADTNAAKNILWIFTNNNGAGLARSVEQELVGNEAHASTPLLLRSANHLV